MPLPSYMRSPAPPEPPDVPRFGISPSPVLRVGRGGSAQSEPDVGRTPGTFNVDVTSPQGIVQSAGQNVVEGGGLIGGLVSAAAGTIGAIGIPGGPTLGDVAATLGGAAGKIIEDVNRRDAYGSDEQIKERFATLPANLRAEAELRMRLNPDRAISIMADAIGAASEQTWQAKVEQAPELLDMFRSPKPPVGPVEMFFTGLNLLGIPAAALQRTILGLAPRWDQIVAVGDGRAVFTSGDPGLTPAEKHAYDMVKSGRWTKDQALDYLMIEGQAFFHDDPAKNLFASVVIDPMILGGLGRGILARLGKAGKALEEMGGIGTGLFTSNRTVAGTLITASKWIERNRNTPLGRVARLVTNAMDPLGIERKRVPEVLAEAPAAHAMQAAEKAYGATTVRAEFRRAAQISRDLLDDAMTGFATFATNIMHRVIATEYVNIQLARGVAAALLERGAETPLQVALKLLREKTPRDVADAVWRKIEEVRPRFFGPSELTSLAKRLAAAFPYQTEGEWRAIVDKMSDDARSFWHATAYGKANEELIKLTTAAARMATVAKARRLQRMVLGNEQTLSHEEATQLLSQLLDKELSIEAKADRIVAAQAKFPDLRFIRFDISRSGQAVESFTRWLKSQIDAGIYPRMLSESELAEIRQMTPALADFIDRYRGVYKIMFRPAKDKLWSLKKAPNGLLELRNEPWVDHVAAGPTPRYRPIHLVDHDVFGRPILSAMGRAVDSLTAMAATVAAQVDASLIGLVARRRFVALARQHGFTEPEAAAIINRIQENAMQRGHTVQATMESELEALQSLIPDRLRLRSPGFGPRELLDLVLIAYEGDLRYIGLAQKASNIVKRKFLSNTGNAPARLVEMAWYLVKFRLYLPFRLQERLDAVALIPRGIFPVFRAKPLSETEQKAYEILDRMVKTGLHHQADIADQAEYMRWLNARDAVQATLQKHAGLRGLTGILSTERVVAAKLKAYMKAFVHGLGSELRSRLDEVSPGFWDRLARHYRETAEGPLTDDDIAVRWLYEQLVANDVSVKRFGSAERLDFDNIVHQTAWAQPSDFGEQRPLFIPELIKRLDFRDSRGQPIRNEERLRAVLHETAGSTEQGAVTMRRLREALQALGAHPDYIRRVENYFSTSWDAFWDVTQESFNLTRAERTALENFFTAAAESRGLTPLEYLTQVISNRQWRGAGLNFEQAANEIIGKTRAILGSREGQATVDDLVMQLTEVLVDHLDPSLLDRLWRRFHRWFPRATNELTKRALAGDEAAKAELAKEAELYRFAGTKWKTSDTETLGKQILDYLRLGPVKGKKGRKAAKAFDLDVIRVAEYFKKWYQQAIRDALLDKKGPESLAKYFRKESGLESAARHFDETEARIVDHAISVIRAKEEDAFMLAYFKRRRSVLERSINHPVFGLYPASYMWGRMMPLFIKFIYREPFGIRTGALAYATTATQRQLMLQRELGADEWDALGEALGKSDVWWFTMYTLPGVPWDLGAGAPAVVRDIAAQGLENEDRAARGEEPQPINVTRALTKQARLVSPTRQFEILAPVVKEISNLFPRVGQQEQQVQVDNQNLSDILQEQAIRLEERLKQ